VFARALGASPQEIAVVTIHEHHVSLNWFNMNIIFSVVQSYDNRQL
jgi:hypothetical protein